MAHRMEAMGMMRVRSGLSMSAVALSLLCSQTAAAAEFELGLKAGVLATDNALLSESPNEVDDIIYQLSPWLNFDHDSKRLDAMLRYKFDWFRYSDLGETSEYHSGVATLTGKALDERFQVAVGARQGQTLSDPTGTIPPDSLPLTTNLVQEQEWWVSPSFVQTFGQTVRLAADYRRGVREYDATAIQNNTNHVGNFALDNYQSGQGLAWALRYEWRRTVYDVAVPWEYQRAWAEVGFWANANTRIFGSSGQESSWDNPYAPALEDPFWEVGFAHTPGEDVSLEFAAGERSFGTSWRGEIDYTFTSGTWRLSYIETPATTGYDIEGGGAIDDIELVNLDDLLTRPGQAQRYLSKRFDWALNFDFRQVGFNLRAYHEERLDIVDAIGATYDDQSQRGLDVALVWRLGSRTALETSFGVFDQDLGAGDESTYSRAGVLMTYKVGRRSELSGGYNYAKQDPQGVVATRGNYKVGIFSIFFSITL